MEELIIFYPQYLNISKRDKKVYELNIEIASYFLFANDQLINCPYMLFFNYFIRNLIAP